MRHGSHVAFVMTMNRTVEAAPFATPFNERRALTNEWLVRAGQSRAGVW
jgi:hypothetical protein